MIVEVHVWLGVILDGPSVISMPPSARLPT